jgi:uncharacterized alkaline shock family protein YloU
VEGSPKISPDVIARYAADAALEVEGVGALVRDRVRRHDGVRVSETDGAAFSVEISVRVTAGESLPQVGRDVQQHVAGYLERMTGASPAAVDVLVREIG